jgi:excisionase family DNA binding protein
MTFFTVAEIANMLKLSVSQVYALVDCGKLRVHRFTTKKHGAVRVSQVQLDEYLKATEEGPKGGPPSPLKLNHLNL